MGPKLKIKKKSSPISTRPKIKQCLLYSKEQMENAIRAIKEEGKSCSSAAKEFNVPQITLLYKIQGKFADKKCGPESCLSFDEENLLVQWILSMGKAGFPVTKHQLLDSVQRLVTELKVKNPDREFPFTDNRPGRHWYVSFLKRHPEISVRTCQNLTISRASVTKDKLMQWHTEVTNYLNENNLMEVMKDSRRVLNADEAAFFLNPKRNKVLYSRGEKMCIFRSKCEFKITENCYVIVEYEEEFFPGMVLRKVENGAEVKVMTMVGANFWKWPEKYDILVYSQEEIKTTIEPPQLKNARGLYSVPEIFKFRKFNKFRNRLPF